MAKEARGDFYPVPIVDQNTRPGAVTRLIVFIVVLTGAAIVFGLFRERLDVDPARRDGVEGLGGDDDLRVMPGDRVDVVEADRADADDDFRVTHDGCFPSLGCHR